MFTFLNNACAQLFEWIFPSVCGYCKKIFSTKQIFCSDCLALISPIISAPLVITKTKMLSVLAVSDYEYPLRALVQAKNQSNRSACRQLGTLIWNHTSVRFAEFDLIVPIPLHWTRYARRWFNQSYEMAQVLSKESGKPLVELLARTKKTEWQAGLSREDRQQNVQKVFSLTAQASAFKGAHILLVDDVMTTGSTLESASRALLPLRPRSLTAAVACRVITK